MFWQNDYRHRHTDLAIPNGTTAANLALTSVTVRYTVAMFSWFTILRLPTRHHSTTMSLTTVSFHLPMWNHLMLMQPRSYNIFEIASDTSTKMRTTLNTTTLILSSTPRRTKVVFNLALSVHVTMTLERKTCSTYLPKVLTRKGQPLIATSPLTLPMRHRPPMSSGGAQ